MFRFANYVFGGEVEQNVNNENIDLNLNECIEEDIDGDWVLIDVPFDGKYKRIDANDDNGNQLQTIAANYETTTTRVPQTHTTDAQQLQQSINSSSSSSCHSGSDIPDTPPPYHQALEESWFVTPPPCFNSLSNPITIETTPLENLLIEHPSISVFGPSLPLPPIHHQFPHSESSSSLSSQTDMSSNDSALVSTQRQSRRQLRQIRRQQQLQLIQQRTSTETNIHLHVRAGVLDELNVLSEMQSREVFQMKKVLTKSNMDRQNKVLVQRNKPPNRRSKMAVRPNGIYNNRKNC